MVGAGNARGWCGFAQLNSGVLDLRITNVIRTACYYLCGLVDVTVMFCYFVIPFASSSSFFIYPRRFTHHLAPGQPLVCTLTDSVRHLPPRPFTPLAAPSFLEVASLEATVKTGKGWKEGSFPSSSVTQPSLRASPHVAAGLEPHLASPFAAGYVAAAVCLSFQSGLELLSV